MTTRVDFEETSQMVHVGGVSLHINRLGSGPPLVLLHGSGPGATSWSNFKQNLPELSKHFTVYAVDQPGYGRSEKPEFTKDNSFLVQTSRALLGLLDEFGIEKTHFLGNSLGGAVALRFTLMYPGRVERLVLMGPGGAAVNVLSPPLSEGFKLLRAFLEHPDRQSLEAFLRIMVYDPSHVTDSLIEERLRDAMDPEQIAAARRVQASLDSLPEDDQLWRYLHKIRVPVLMTWGRDDRVLPLDAALFALRRMPDARLHVFPRCGHWAQLEHQVEFDRLVIGFLNGGPE